MKRRDFLRAGMAGSAVLFAAGCGDNLGGLESDADGGPERCIATESNIEGPFYTPGAPERSILVTPDMPGTRLRVTGRVLSRSCAALAGATVDVWQANADGDYDNAGFALRGVMTTDADGSFELHTIIPGRYLNGSTYRPAHIHVKAAAPGHALLTTQLYFAGDPYNQGDPWIRDSLVMTLEDSAEGDMLAFHDIVLTPT